MAFSKPKMASKWRPDFVISGPSVHSCSLRAVQMNISALPLGSCSLMTLIISAQSDGRRNGHHRDRFRKGSCSRHCFIKYSEPDFEHSIWSPNWSLRQNQSPTTHRCRRSFISIAMVAPDGDFHAPVISRVLSTPKVRRIILWSHHEAAMPGHIDKIPQVVKRGWTSLLDEDWQNENENWTPNFCFLSKDYSHNTIQQYMKQKRLLTESARLRELPNDVNLIALQDVLWSGVPTKYGNENIDAILVMARNTSPNHTYNFHQVVANLTGESRSSLRKTPKRPFVAMLESPGSWKTEKSFDQSTPKCWILKNSKHVESYYRGT